MKTVSELLREADPLGYEPFPSAQQRERISQAMLDAAVWHSPEPARLRTRSWAPAFIALAAIVIVALVIGARMWSPFLSPVNAAIRFEVRLAEEKPAPGLREAKISGTNRSVYLHNEVVVSNADISSAGVMQSAAKSQYSVSVLFNASGAEKMRTATGANVGKLMAILLDGEVVMAPTIRSPITDSALITGRGDFTKAQAERIVSGITVR